MRAHVVIGLCWVASLHLTGPTAAAAQVPVVEGTTPEWVGGDRRLGREPVLQLGAVDGNGPDAFGNVTDVRFLHDGMIGVTDNRTVRVVVFDSIGQHVRTLGRSGQGPGEFIEPFRLFPYPGDSVAVFDYREVRTQVFPDGDGGSRAVSNVHEAFRASVLGALSSGSWMSYQPLYPESPKTGSGWDSTRVLLVDREGADSRPVATLPWLVTGANFDANARVLSPRAFLVSTDDGFYWARSDRYEIMRFDSLGAPRYVIRRPVTPEPIGAAERREYTTGTIEGARRGGGDEYAASIEVRIRAAEFADTRPLFGRAFVDRDHRLWVSDLPWPSRYDAPTHWSVFSDAGHWLGDVYGPSDVWLYDARDDRVLGLWSDEFGVSYVRVYSMESR